MRRHPGRAGSIARLVAMDERNHTGQWFAVFMGVASSADCSGGGGYNCKLPSRARSIAGKPSNDNARGRLMAISVASFTGALSTDLFPDFVGIKAPAKLPR
jgi:hypothetical protein